MTTAMDDLLPGARLLHYVLRDLADEDGRVTAPSAELLKATGWNNRASLRKRTHDLEDAGLIVITPSVREDGGRGPNTYELKG